MDSSATLDALTAFGTVGAVIVALWLAGRGRAEIIRGRAGERLIIQMGMRADEGTPIINIEVTNLTHRPVTISNIGWRVGIFRRQHFVQIPDYRASTELSDSHEARLRRTRELQFS